jgi:hypothetical protein
MRNASTALMPMISVTWPRLMAGMIIRSAMPLSARKGAAPK